jgi:DNA-binding response OmpR family regulator
MRDVKMKKIIIADSLKNFIEQDVSLIAGYDNKVFYIKTAREALDIHRKERANLIIITLDYPDLSCERICSAIRGDEVLKTVSILIVCSEKLSDIERCLRCGASDYITHPLSPAAFLLKVSRLLNVSERTSYRVIVKAVNMDDHKAAHIFCSSKNISSSGLLLETDAVFNKGNKLICSFFLPNSIRIVADGEIMRIHEKENGLKEYGVRFIDIPHSVELQIASFVENWLKRKISHS